MDDLVAQALARWPNVPAIAGWLRLSAQGHWLLTGPVPEGLSISNERIRHFISRNYDCDGQGRWYFQNGPQKVYVSLEVTPWVFHVFEYGANDLPKVTPEAGASVAQEPTSPARLLLMSHTGLVTVPKALLMDELGRIFIDTPLGLGLLASNDATRFAAGISETEEAWVHTGVWCVPADPVQAMAAVRLPVRLASGQQPCTLSLSMPVESVESFDLPGRYDYVLNPEVSA